MKIGVIEYTRVSLIPFNPEKNKAFPKLVNPVIDPLASVTTDNLNEIRAITPVKNIPEAIKL